MTDDPAAAILAPDLGPALPAQVEAALAARDTDQRRSQYFDPVAVAGLIVSIAGLAWTIYNDLRSRASDAKAEPEPDPEVFAREVRIKLRNRTSPCLQAPSG